jgi:hypothetical protein
VWSAYHAGGHGFLLLVRSNDTRVLGSQPLLQCHRLLVHLDVQTYRGQRRPLRLLLGPLAAGRGGGSLRAAAEAGTMSSSVKKWFCGWKKGQRTEVTELSPTR